VALRPIAPSLPFKLPDSWRPLDPTMPVGAPLQVTDPTTGNAITVTNNITNFGWEYVWHCHLLGHEENDMMRPMIFQVSPAQPQIPIVTAAAAGPLAKAATASGLVATVTWQNRATTPAATSFTIQRATDAAFAKDVKTFSVPASQTTLNDTSVGSGVTYYYRVRAENRVAYSIWTQSASASSSVTPGVKLTIGTKKVKIAKGKTIVLRGALSPARSGVVSVFVKKRASKRWGTIGNVALRAGGKWTAKFKPTKRGKYQFYATWNNDTSSTLITVRVK
jgi:FtsP/CotA-like multicopper oxidase with cupredoxin domain